MADNNTFDAVLGVQDDISAWVSEPVPLTQAPIKSYFHISYFIIKLPLKSSLQTVAGA